MRSGNLRHRIAIQTDTETLDADGGVVHSWATAATRWGSIKPVSGDEKIDGQRFIATTTHLIKIRYYSGTLGASQRLLFGSRVFGILSVTNEFERDRSMLIMCKEQL
jgi:SPP1 family predicted phage head-tail adaptor